jgi:hypothetical protein
MIGPMRQEPSGTVRRAASGIEWWIPLALVVVGVVFVLIAWTTILSAQHSAGWGYDFRAYYEAAVRLMATGSPYQAETLGGPFQPGPSGLYLYTPVPALLIVPLTWLDASAATVIWLFIRLGLVAGMCALMPVPRWVKLAMLGVSIVSYQFLIDLNLGNVSLIVTFFAVVAWRWLDKPLSGLAIAASLTIRPTMGVIWVWWLIRRQWQAALWTVIGFGAIFLASLPFLGLNPWFEFVTVLRNVSNVMGVPHNLDFGSMALSLGLTSTAGFALELAGYALAIGAMLLSLRRDREIGFAVTLMASLLLTPLLWDHYLTNLVVPGALLAARGRRWGVLLPMLGWLPLIVLPFVTAAGMLLPFVAPDRGPAALDLGADEPQPVPDVDTGLSGTAGA